jgi:hypothetical protein
MTIKLVNALTGLLKKKVVGLSVDFSWKEGRNVARAYSWLWVFCG